MKKYMIFFFILFFWSKSIAQITALVGGTLIDGFGSKPILNSVVIIEGEKISEVGTIGQIKIPAGAKIISTEGMTGTPRVMGHACAYDDQWPFRLCLLG